MVISLGYLKWIRINKIRREIKEEELQSAIFGWTKIDSRWICRSADMRHNTS